MNFSSIFYSWIILIMEFNRKKYRAYGSIKHSEPCKELLENFAAASASFMFCTIQNARPVQICSSCIEEYNNILEHHDYIVQSKQNSSCAEKLINQDRLEVIETGFSYVKDLWKRGQCKNCFENGNSLSNSTKEFIKLYSDTKQCLENQYNLNTSTYNPSVCLICSKLYYKMSKFYQKLKVTSGNGNVCIDILDSVNVTQHLWSNVLHCGETVMAVECTLIAFSTVFFLILICFYSCAWILAKDRSSAVLNQNRVFQRFRDRCRSQSSSWISS